MPRSLALGNGNILVCLDKYAQVRDLYFPFVGLENHVSGHYLHRIGVLVDNKLRWLNHPSWNVSVNCSKNALVSNIKAINNDLKIDLEFSDAVYNEKDIFLRKVTIYNKEDKNREVKIYFGHEFEIYESHRGDTAYFDPNGNSVIHYNGRRVFLINGRYGERSFDDYTTGIFKIEGKEGSFKDAEDGVLSQNPIEHGLTDSVIGFYFSVGGGEKRELYYWITVSETIKGAKELNDYILNRTPEHLLRTTHDFWRAWANKYSFSFYGLDENAILLFKKSLFNIRAHTDNRGAIIASGDSDMLQNGRDTYSYMWPRDGAFSAIALDMAGDTNVTRRFFEFCNNVVTGEGYFMHKYRPDESLGSSWHPWIRNGEAQLPIQEDETALVIYSLWKHYATAKDLEFVEKIYNSLIKKSADFMVEYRDKKTGLPKPSYDLWEEKFGTSTFSSATVYGALMAAANFANILGKEKSEKRYKDAAEEIKKGILEHLYDDKDGIFYKMINFKDEEFVYDRTLDMSSIYGIFAFGILEAGDERMEKAINKVKDRLVCKTSIQGVARYEGDLFQRRGVNIPGNPWFITTLWFAQYYIAKAEKISDFDEVKRWIDWTVDNSIASGVLSEQLDPHTGEQLSAAPLTWSHAEFVITIIKYLDKLEELGICDKCNPIEKF
jgi:GH15 family glucan-1,4-alpha-glucosidase